MSVPATKIAARTGQHNQPARRRRHKRREPSSVIRLFTSRFERITALRAIDGNNRHAVGLAAAEQRIDVSVLSPSWRLPVRRARSWPKCPGRPRCTWCRAHASPASLELAHSREHQPGTAHAERMAERDGAAVRVHMLRILRQAEVAQDGDALGGESLVEFDEIDLVRYRCPSCASSLRVAGTGPMPITRGATPAEATPTTRALT